ncbi:MmgE/PrpD family protein [Neobacillus drentensis]|uniref:MmgE/PrpD family protein n=1 Tax=Neobacillus drentensis TaxID=220684 RepID=UPI002860ABF9|nr:MmgE/PrpD family protein [Neobacillus drentensis]MDR7239166.1 2-methylcitrate dehydratase PrpD [Neobacillus drentensis]
MSSSLMDRLVEYITTCHYQQLPEKLIVQAKYAILDTVGATLAGWNEPVVQIVKRGYMSENPSKKVLLLGEPIFTELEYAALINGTASHALDYDDVSPSILAHPSAPILAAVIPLAEHLQCSSKDVITAYAIGTEVMIKLGLVMGHKHYDLGWHATDTLGTIGAAAACAYLMNLNPDQITHAIGIACSMSGGLQKNFGTMTKPFHVGLASSHGLQAAWLAKQGLTANKDIFESRGFFFSFSGGMEKWGLMEDIQFGKPYSLLETGLSIKKFPCCYLTHRIIQGALDLKDEFQLELSDVMGIEILTPPAGLVALIHHHPKTGLEGKFSAEYTVLAAIRDGHVGLSTFEDEQVQTPEIQQLIPQVKATEEEGEILLGQELEKSPIQILVTTKNGILKKDILLSPGSKESPLSQEDLRLKWQDCIAHWLKKSGIDNSACLGERASNLFNKGLLIEDYDRFGSWLIELREFHLINKK